LKSLSLLWPPNAAVTARNAFSLRRTEPWLTDAAACTDERLLGSLDAALGWLCRSQDAVGSGGVGCFEFYGWTKGYPEVTGYIVDVCRGTRTAPAVQLGASPRAATALLSTSKAWAWLSGRDFVTPDDVKALVRPTLRHRLMLRPEAELDGLTTDGVLESVLASVPVPK